ncbi:MAG: hypothetical protein AAGK37_06235 [Pseudomonadota bacterium]
MRVFLACLGFAVVAGCGEGGPRGERQAEAARELARPTVTEVIAKEYPGVSVTPLTTCVLNTLTEDELARVAQAALQGFSGRDTQFIRSVVRRSETRICAFDAGVTGFF